jgi:toxin YoeB
LELSLILSDVFREDILKLKKEDAKLPGKVWELILDIHQNIQSPTSGLGKPEALKGNFSGYWSRRINERHRLIYKVDNNVLKLAACYGHYSNK